MVEGVTEKNDAGSAAVNRDQLAEVVHAVVFESGLLKKQIERELESSLKGAIKPVIGEYVKNDLSKALGDMVQKAVTDLLNSEEIKVLIDSKFRAITLYLKTDVIPKVVKQCLAQAEKKKSS